MNRRRLKSWPLAASCLRPGTTFCWMISVVPRGDKDPIDRHQLPLTQAEIRALRDHLTKLTTGRIVVTQAVIPMVRTGGVFPALRSVLRKLDALES